MKKTQLKRICVPLDALSVFGLAVLLNEIDGYEPNDDAHDATYTALYDELDRQVGQGYGDYFTDAAKEAEVYALTRIQMWLDEEQKQRATLIAMGLLPSEAAQ